MHEQAIITMEQFFDPETLWAELQPFPYIDWRPICYDSQYNKLNGCDPGHIIVPTCRQCPWLAARHKTEVNRKME